MQYFVQQTAATSTISSLQDKEQPVRDRQRAGDEQVQAKGLKQPRGQRDRAMPTKGENGIGQRKSEGGESKKRSWREKKALPGVRHTTKKTDPSSAIKKSLLAGSGGLSFSSGQFPGSGSGGPRPPVQVPVRGRVQTGPGHTEIFPGAGGLTLV